MAPPDLRDLLRSISPTSKPTDPLEIFDGLRLRNSGVAELWRPQSDALRLWHESRELSDVLFKLNTGAGKTLLGLLAAQSLVNETSGKVIYVCATNQLLEQTKEKAEEYGIPTAEYYAGSWHGDVYHRGLGPGLTNYQAVFNGKSIFRRENLLGVVLDDAHTAHGIIRDQFTVRVSRTTFPDLYRDLVAKYAGYFDEAGRRVAFRDVTEHLRDPSVLFVPSFISVGLAETTADLLIKGGVEDETSTLFAWEYLRERLRDCAVLIDRNAVDFTPPLVPIHVTAPFRDGIRRLYLSATLPDDELFCRTFGRFPGLVVEPGGRAGDTERLILPAHRDVPDDSAREWAKRILADRKGLIMVPSFEAAGAWSDVADVFDSSEGHERVREFAESHDDKLVLAARYDGVDLPGDACRLMVVDGLPVGQALIEKFFENHLEAGRISDALVASRITQLFGRISRGMSDFGVVLLVSQRLRWWLDAPENRARLPVAIRRQLALADLLSSRYDEYPPAKVAEDCLQRADEWISLYDGFMESDAAGAITAQPAGPDRNRDRQVPEGEQQFIQELWSGEPGAAAAALDRIRAKLFDQSRPHGAWYLHWQAHAVALMGDEATAEDLYRQAGRISRELGVLPTTKIEGIDPDAGLSAQAERATDLLMKRGRGFVDALRKAAETLRIPTKDVDAESEVTAGQHEEAVEVIGKALGLEVTRPDATDGTGPDVLWETPSGGGILFELKTGKGSNSYNKEEVGQLHDHAQWGRERFGADHKLVLAGPRLPTTANSHPPADVLIVTPDAIAEVGTTVSAILDQALLQNLPLFRGPTIQKGLADNGLIDVDVLEAMGPTRLLKMGTST
ncbi:DEAD/DEAH box helicase family protein [Gemmatimonadota bacterium]